MMRKALVVVGAAILAFGGTAGAAFADSGADGSAIGSPGVLSGNVIQVPVHVPVNLCGTGVDLVGLLNPTAGTGCLNG